MAPPEQKKLRCHVEFEGGSKEGVYANAFRIVEGDEVNCFLDFLIYSEKDNEAKVVTRVRINRCLLPDIRDRMKEAVVDSDGDEIFEPIAAIFPLLGSFATAQSN